MLTIPGGIIGPLQSLYLSTATIKWPTGSNQAPGLIDIYDFLDATSSKAEEIALKTRFALTTTDTTSPQGRLWTGQPINCSSTSSALPEVCRLQTPGKTFENMSLLPDPFLAQLPPDYNTGVLRQYLLRINSTAKRDTITESEFPACDSIPGAFYVQYGAVNPNVISMTGWGDWGLSVCMPANMSQSPWRATRDRQDFSEEMFLNISVDNVSLFLSGETNLPNSKKAFFRITVDTTAGYFELPNHMNGQKPGPLLEHCDESCNSQNFVK